MAGKYEFPTATFPYKITRRLNLMSRPRPYFIDKDEGMPLFSVTGVRMSALRGHASDRVNDAAWPYLRRLILLKRLYKNKFNQERLEKIDRMIEYSNATLYSKIANCAIDLRKQDNKDVKKKKAWSDSEWKKHMEYINTISKPRRDFKPAPIKRGKGKPLEDLIPRILLLSYLPEFKMYKRLSQEAWYRNPVKVSPAAMKYEITENIKKLATPRATAGGGD